MLSPTRITVTDKASTYITNTVRGQRASSTAGYRFAAQVLCHKLFPSQTVELRLVEEQRGRHTFEAVVKESLTTGQP